ncbi:pentraxin-related protein PTX3-like [Pristis pectinata]|uniref:pentraxin-related protein PTX3-like n=1 Tax=Pristis pectinata TaxID=685728 RepID=UPI00223CDC32|nr:pentraxin-related protein PTX3-like [Pristis pectinata]
MAALCSLLFVLSSSLWVTSSLSYLDTLGDDSEDESGTCRCGRELSRWDKVFVMLEDSQMRQSMLLSTVRDTLPGLVGALRAEVRQAAQLGREWPELLRLARGLDHRLRAVEGRLERAASPGSAPGPEVEPGGCPGLGEEPRQDKAGLGAPKPQVAMETPDEDLPAGCQRTMALTTLQPTAFPVDGRDLLAFTTCLWAKLSGVTTGKTVLLTYCSEGASTLFQLYLSRGLAFFAVGPAEVKARAGPIGKWAHYCGIWDGATGNATLVVDGKAARSSPATGARAIPSGGAVRLGGGCRVSADPSPFAGKLAGFNLWDTAAPGWDVVRLLRSGGCLVGMGASRVRLHPTRPPSRPSA